MALLPLGVALLSGLGLLSLVVGVTYLRQPGIVQQRLDQFGTLPRALEDIELQQPFRERVLQPVFRSIARVIQSRTPQSTLDQIKHDLLVAGSPGGLDVRDILGLKGLGAFVAGGVSLLFFARSLPILQGAVIGGALTVVGFYLPNFWLGSRIRGRKKEIQKALPDALDLLTICVEAGLGFDAALHKVTEKWSNALTLEFGRVLQEIRMGRSRRDALRDLVTRTDVPDVATFVAAIVQADQLGVSIGNVLLTQAEQMRIKRRQRAEQLAQQAPIKIIFPLVLLIFPALFVVILGPAIPAVLEGISGGQ